MVGHKNTRQLTEEKGAGGVERDRNCSDHVTSLRGKSKTGTHTPAGEFQAVCGEDKGDTKTH